MQAVLGWRRVNKSKKSLCPEEADMSEGQLPLRPGGASGRGAQEAGAGGVARAVFHPDPWRAPLPQAVTACALCGTRVGAGCPSSTSEHWVAPVFRKRPVVCMWEGLSAYLHLWASMPRPLKGAASGGGWHFGAPLALAA